MIDYQSKFKQKLVFLLLIIFLLPLIIILYLGKNLDTNVQKNTLLSIEKSTTLNLRGTIKDIQLSKDSKTAYLIAGSRGVYIIDIENTLKPKLISQFKYFKNSYDKAKSIELAQESNRLFIRDAQAGIYSIDIENPLEPILLATYKSNLAVYDICISKDEDTLYISDEDGITIADIREPDTIKTMSKFATNKKYFDMVEVKENILYLLSSYGIDILDVSVLKRPETVGNYVALGDSKKMTLSNDKTRAFLSNGSSGVEILDIANKLNPKPLGIFKTSKVINLTIVSKDAETIYVSNLNDSIAVVDIRNPDDAKQLQEININPAKKAKVCDMALSKDENKLLIANGVDGMKIIQLK